MKRYDLVFDQAWVNGGRHRPHFRGFQEVAIVGKPYCIAAFDLGLGHDLDVLGDQGTQCDDEENSRPFGRNVLVRIAFSSDVFGHALDDEKRHFFSPLHVCRDRSDGGSVLTYDLDSG